MNKSVNEQATIAYMHLMDSFNPDSEIQPTLIWEETDETFFCAVLVALTHLCHTISRRDIDTVGMISILNRVLIQEMTKGTDLAKYNINQGPCKTCKHAGQPECQSCEDCSGYEKDEG